MSEDAPAAVDVLRLLPSERPAGYRHLSDAEKAVRGRYFLMVYAMGASELFAWANALNADPDHTRDIRETVGGVEDAAIADALHVRRGR